MQKTTSEKFQEYLDEMELMNEINLIPREQQQETPQISEKKLHVVPGNTIEIQAPNEESDYIKSGRTFFITIQKSNFKNCEKIIDYLTHFKNFRYLIMAEHDGPTNVHRHVYVQYSKPTDLRAKQLFNSNLREHFRTAKENIDYCLCKDKKHIEEGVKGTLIKEIGTPAHNGGNRIKDVKKMSNKELDNLPIQYYRIAADIKKKRSYKIKINECHKKILVIYLYGGTKIGKSKIGINIMTHLGYDEYNDLKFANDFYTGTDGEDDTVAALYDDFRDSEMKPNEFIRLIDYNKHTMNIKGGSKVNCYELIIITSVQDPNDLWAYSRSSYEAKQQWLRRINLINFYDDEFKNFDCNNEDDMNKVYKLVDTFTQNNKL